MELSDTMIQNMLGLVSGLIGALIGGLFTLYATNKVIRESNEKENRQEEKEVQNLLEALRVEIGTLWTFHMRRVGALIENLQDGQALEFYYPLTQDYFTVYNTNASRIGQVKQDELRDAIVVCYNKCKKVVDGFKYNNELYRDYTQVSATPIDLPQHKALVKARLDKLADYARVIREDHYEVKGYVERMLALLAPIK